MDLNKLSKESFKNVLRRTGKLESGQINWRKKLKEESKEWINADFKKSAHCPTLTNDEEEAVDVILVMLTYMASCGYDIERAVKTKHEFNLKREDKL